MKMVNIVKDLRTENGEKIHMRVGIHSGKAAGGVVGIKKFRYHVRMYIMQCVTSCRFGERMLSLQMLWNPMEQQIE